MRTQLKGSTLLKVVGIIMTVLAGIAILTSLAAFTGGAVLMASFLDGPSDGWNGMGEALGFLVGIVFLAAGIALIGGAALNLVFGILAIRWCARAERASALFIIGLVQIALAGLRLLFGAGTALTNGDAGALAGALVSAAAALPLPVLYTLGAWWNRQGLLAPAPAQAPAAPAPGQAGSASRPLYAPAPRYAPQTAPESRAPEQAPEPPQGEEPPCAPDRPGAQG